MAIFFCSLLYSSVSLSYSRLRLSDWDFIASLSLRSRFSSDSSSAMHFLSSSACIGVEIKKTRYYIKVISQIMKNLMIAKCINVNPYTNFVSWWSRGLWLVSGFVFLLLLGKQTASGSGGWLGLFHRGFRLGQQLGLGCDERNQAANYQRQENGKAGDVEVTLGTEQPHAVLHSHVQVLFGGWIWKSWWIWAFCPSPFLNLT